MPDEQGKPPLGYKIKSQDDLTITKDSMGVEKSKHTVTQARKNPKPEKLENPEKIQKKRFAKESKHAFEAGIASFYRYLLGPDRAPKTRSIRDFGILSNKIPGFTTFTDAADDYSNPCHRLTTARNLATAGMGSLLAANYLMQENDCHAKNFGFNDKGKLARIDFDHSLSPLNKFEGYFIETKVANKTIKAGQENEPQKYVFERIPENGIIEDFEEYHQTKAVHFCFSTVTQKDLSNLVLAESFTPYNSPFLFGRGSRNQIENFNLGVAVADIEENLDNKEYQLDKWKIFLKASLLTKDMIENILRPNIGDEELLIKLRDHIFDRFQQVTSYVLSNPSFQKIMEKYGNEMIEQTKQEINDYNTEFEKPRDAFLKVTPLSNLAQYKDHENHFTKTELTELNAKLKKLEKMISEKLNKFNSKDQSFLVKLKQIDDLLERINQLFYNGKKPEDLKYIKESIKNLCDGINNYTTQLKGAIKYLKKQESKDVSEKKRNIELLENEEKEMDTLNKKLTSFLSEKPFIESLVASPSFTSHKHEQTFKLPIPIRILTPDSPISEPQKEEKSEVINKTDELKKILTEYLLEKEKSLQDLQQKQSSRASRRDQERQKNKIQLAKELGEKLSDSIKSEDLEDFLGKLSPLAEETHKEDKEIIEQIQKKYLSKP
ncbi:MAG: hypothetical protein A3I12_03380 [Gammaproteobacteria bacterium RIFCSPLOWO2_02_FULL_38_11]|nr:MAG: hypothetical protein A3B69_00045 [Gammaproteobacteria bacterium RIFCSPHIGHO2_02_FULL_38_33]OGT66721.1 MAG: hypothetical protein A3I12_03380 [Gammaproteobacteria bacterium RIFCSPLOWO2_02_FULL_38_11]OGT77357.1 MAG: hypothetical protein A3G71_00905 [Gammaproteobacteria bacterium RIFCSPLOWO2_12_FULL_38_14]